MATGTQAAPRLGIAPTCAALGLSRARDFDPRKTTARLVDLLETIAVESGAS